jgi:hypothetical protein
METNTINTVQPEGMDGNTITSAQAELDAQAREENIFYYYQHRQQIFLLDFFAKGYCKLNITIEPRDDVESGLWHSARYETSDGRKRTVSAQWQRLMWYRLIKEYLMDEGIPIPDNPPNGRR